MSRLTGVEQIQEAIRLLGLLGTVLNAAAKHQEEDILSHIANTFYNMAENKVLVRIFNNMHRKTEIY